MQGRTKLGEEKRASSLMMENWDSNNVGIPRSGFGHNSWDGSGMTTSAACRLWFQPSLSPSPLFRRLNPAHLFEGYERQKSTRTDRHVMWRQCFASRRAAWVFSCDDLVTYSLKLVKSRQKLRGSHVQVLTVQGWSKEADAKLWEKQHRCFLH